MQEKISIHWRLGADEAEIPDGLRTVILYEDLSAGERALRVISRLEETLNSAVDLQPALWRFDCLGEPALAELAFADSEDAGLIVIATGRSNSLPLQARKWLKACLQKRQDKNLAMVALLNSDGGSDGKILQFLDQAAREADLPVFRAFAQRSICAEANPRAALAVEISA